MYKNKQQKKLESHPFVLEWLDFSVRYGSDKDTGALVFFPLHKDCTVPGQASAQYTFGTLQISRLHLDPHGPLVLPFLPPNPQLQSFQSLHTPKFKTPHQPSSSLSGKQR